MDVTAVSALFAQLDRELWLVTAASGGRRGGLIATFVSQASIVPSLPRMVLGVARQHHTWQMIEGSGAFALHLLAEEQLSWVERFGMHSGRDLDKLEGLNVHVGASGSPILTDALGWLDCRVEAKLNTGDRTVYLAEALDGSAPRGGTMLTAKRLLQLASPETMQELKAQMQRDIAVDAAAIEAFRRTV